MTRPRPLHLASVLEAVADAVPHRIAIVTLDRSYSYAEIDERASRLANHLASVGVVAGDHVAIHASNRIAWVDAWFACFKLGAVPININYRYLHDELSYLYRDADCVAAIVAPEHVDAVRELEVPTLRHLMVMDEHYERVLAEAPSHRRPARSGDDRYILYTGGTTGAPKGVVWRHADLIVAALNASRLGAPIESVEQLAREAHANATPMVMLAGGPLMHGGSQWILGNAIVSGSTVALHDRAGFEPEDVLGLVDHARVNSLTVLGDAMGRPLAEAILDHPGRWDLSSLFAVSNGAAPMSEGVREQLRRALPGRVLLDSYGSSESGATAARLDDGSSATAGAPTFPAGPDIEVFDIDMRPCPVGVEGLLARSGPMPLGYYKDEVKTAATFKEIDGVRWSVPGDLARREPDGSVTILGRGSVSINTGGEKVHPEEVEAVLLQHEDVFDAAVVATPHERWGQQVTALVQLRAGRSPSEADVKAFVRGRLASYKVPKRVLVVDQIPRTAVSKVDYRTSTELAATLVGARPRAGSSPTTQSSAQSP